MPALGKYCTIYGCKNLAIPNSTFCSEHLIPHSLDHLSKQNQPYQPMANIKPDLPVAKEKTTGGNNSYWLVNVDKPKRLKPYEAECEDIIEALGMTFAEGCAFKAIWRRCAARKGNAKTDYAGQLYDAQKAVYYAQRMVAQDEKTMKETK